MKRLSMLAISSLLLVSTAFAAEKQEVEQAKVEQPKVEKQQITAIVQVAGQTIATLTQTNDVVLSLQTQSDKEKPIELVYVPENKVSIYKGKCTLEVRKGGKRILQLVVDDGVVIMGPANELEKTIEQFSGMVKSKVEK